MQAKVKIREKNVLQVLILKQIGNVQKCQNSRDIMLKGRLIKIRRVTL